MMIIPAISNLPTLLIWRRQGRVLLFRSELLTFTLLSHSTETYVRKVQFTDGKQVGEDAEVQEVLESGLI